MSPFLRAAAAAAAVLAAPALWGAEGPRLKVALVQSAIEATVEENASRITGFISKAAAAGARVVVFPEGILSARSGGEGGGVEGALARIREAARAANVYVIYGGRTYSEAVKKDVNWMRVVDPGGVEILRYDKLYDDHRARMPGVFHLDGVPAGGMICADRWLRGVEEIPIQQGAQISIELADNYPAEWVEAYQWYWYVGRALRNNVWVLFSNTASGGAMGARHGHSAIIAPDGRVIASSPDDGEQIVMADIDASLATRAEARARASHPDARPFWEAGLKAQAGETAPAPAFTPLVSPEAEVTLAVAQITNDPPAMEAMIREARARKADLVAFPANATNRAGLGRLRRAAGANRMTVVAGVEGRAFVIGPDGALLTEREEGRDLSSMWFRVKGVPAVVTLGREGLWNEIAELAALVGAQIHVHLDDDASTGAEARLRRLQVWSNLASFHTFSATANVVDSAIWDDLRSRDEVRAYLNALPDRGCCLPFDFRPPKPDSGAAEVYATWAANLVTRAGEGRSLLAATRRVNARNTYHPARTVNMNPQMASWYALGAQLILPAEKRTQGPKMGGQRRARLP